MAKSLKSNCIRKCKFSTSFRMDVFKYLFQGKGVRPSFGQGTNYEKENFDERFFPSNCNVAYDHLEDGCKVHYLIPRSSKIKWSPIVYEKENNGVLVRTFTEVIVLDVVKRRC